MKLSIRLFSSVVIGVLLIAWGLSSTDLYAKSDPSMQKKRYTFTGHVDGVRGNSVVIDDFVIELAPGVRGVIRKGSYVKYTLDEKGRIVKVEPISMRNRKKSKSKPINRGQVKGRDDHNRIKNRDGMWRNY